MKWRTILIPSAFVVGGHPAQEAWEAETDDGHPIQCLIWGRGSSASPLTLFVRVGEQVEVGYDYQPPTAPGVDASAGIVWPARQPTLEELEEATNRFSPRGALMGLGPLTSKGPGAELTTDVNAPWYGVPLIQAGVAEGSPAARRSLILTPGGKTDAN